MFKNLFGKSSNKLTVSEFKVKFNEEGGEVIDVRSKGEFKQGHLRVTTKNINVLDDFENRIQKLDKEQNYFLYCQSGNRSGRAARIMKNNGFEKVFNVGGINKLARNGFEIKF